MKTVGSFIAFCLFAAPLASYAADLSALNACVSDGYKKLSNRNGIVVAVLDSASSTVTTYGQAKSDQIFEIGSISKTFTATLLAEDINLGQIQLKDEIPSEYQKAGTKITYEELTTHTSGITGGVFPNFKIRNELSPFEGLTIPLFKELYSQTPLDSTPGEKWAYSNIGASLLGLILAERSEIPYEQLVQDSIFNRLGMHQSYFEVPADKLGDFPQGWMTTLDGTRVSIPHWDLFNTAIDPAGGIRSTINDMITYARANLAPEQTTLASAIQLSHQPLYFIKDHNLWIGMNWILQPEDNLIWHNGRTYGFNSILAISTSKHQAVVALTDTNIQVKSANGDTGFDDSLQQVAFACLKAP